jgi:hypothetical protein
MHLKRRGLSNFEACSVALFTSLALGGAALPARSQTSSTPSVTATTSPARTGAAIPPDRWTPGQLAQAFRRTDDDGDGRLSRRFDQVDSNKDGSISSTGFDEALK